MGFYEIQPEVAGGVGPNGILDHTVRPPRIVKFHYVFDGWLGDPLLETAGSFIVTESLKRKIMTLQPTGVAFGDVEVSKSGEFEDFFPDQELPTFVWLQVIGDPGKDDFGLSPKQNLVVSERVLDVLRKTGMSHCDIAEFQAA